MMIAFTALLGVSALMVTSIRSAPTLAETRPTTTAPTAGMVFVPAGRFQMGWDGEGGRYDERPAHQVHVDAFWIDQTEVTNEQFAAFSGNLDQLNFLSASGMIGREVSGIDVDGVPLQGTVDGVQLVGSIVYLTVGERQMSMAGVETIG